MVNPADMMGGGDPTDKKKPTGLQQQLQTPPGPMMGLDGPNSGDLHTGVKQMTGKGPTRKHKAHKGHGKHRGKSKKKAKR